MSENNEPTTNIIPVDFDTIKIQLVPRDQITLPIEAAGELSKDYIFIDRITKLMKGDTHQEVATDGEIEITNTVINPNLLQWMHLKLKYIQTSWKMCGGEIDNEAKKETMKLFSSLLYDTLKDDSEAIEKAKELWKKQYSPGNSEK